MEAVRSSENLVQYHITTGCHKPEDRFKILRNL